MKDLVGILRAAGIDVWAIGLQPQPQLVAAAELAGIDASRCLGIRQNTDRDKFAGRLREPIPIRGGAVDALVGSLGRPSELVIAARDDFELLMLYGGGLRVLVDRGDTALRRKFEAAGALIQPQFQ